MPPRRFDVVRTGLDYVPTPRRDELVEHLLGFCDRLVVGVHNEERDEPRLERRSRAGGSPSPAGPSARIRTLGSPTSAFWIDTK